MPLDPKGAERSRRHRAKVRALQEADAANAILERELATVRAERDDYRTRWLRLVDANNRLRTQMEKLEEPSDG